MRKTEEARHWKEDRLTPHDQEEIVLASRGVGPGPGPCGMNHEPLIVD